MPDQLLRTWRVADDTWHLGRFPRLMGIVNVTPDSFSDGGAFLDAERAIEHGLRLVAEGADLLDVGGESTRPGAAVVPADEELRRVLPVVAGLVERTDVPVSIDTSKASVARACLDAGAVVVNDVTGLEGDPAMPAVCATAGCAVIAMHTQGNPRTMQDDPTYEDCVAEIAGYLAGRVEALVAAGIDAERICLDPGIGFGKKAAHNLEILSSIDRLRALGRPVLIGHSRKRFLSKVLGREVEERTAGTLGVAIALAAQHCDLIRVHDVRATRDALVAWHEVEKRRGPAPFRPS
jgi:dihydropteroate synthase